jgi:hypothetical protein
MLPENSIPRFYFMIMEKIRLVRLVPRLRLRRLTSVLVIKCPTLLTCVENSYCPSHICHMAHPDNSNTQYLIQISVLRAIQKFSGIHHFWEKNNFSIYF